MVFTSTMQKVSHYSFFIQQFKGGGGQWRQCSLCVRLWSANRPAAPREQSMSLSLAAGLVASCLHAKKWALLWCAPWKRLQNAVRPKLRTAAIISQKQPKLLIVMLFMKTHHHIPAYNNIYGRKAFWSKNVLKIFKLQSPNFLTWLGITLLLYCNKYFLETINNFLM